VGLGIAVVLALPAPISGQEQELLKPGSHVRVLAPSVFDSLLVGHVLALRDDSMLLQHGLSRARTDVPYGAIERLEVTEGRSRSKGAWTGAAYGAVGLGVLTAWPALALSESGSEALTAVFIGAVIGAGRPKQGAAVVDRWLNR
jgi:hypothetical protein